MSWRQVFKDAFPADALQHYIRANDGIVNSTVFQGTLYELTVVRELMDKLRLQHMQVVGGSYDAGIDIRGKWDVLPIREAVNDLRFEDLPKRLKIRDTAIKPWIHRARPGKLLDCYVQCKAFNSEKVSGRQVRELLGTFSMRVPASRRNSSLMIMSSPTFFTKDGLALFNEAGIPMVYVKVDMIKRLPDGGFDVRHSGTLQHYYENHYASQLLANCGIKEWLKLKRYQQPPGKDI